MSYHLSKCAFYLFEQCYTCVYRFSRQFQAEQNDASYGEARPRETERAIEQHSALIRRFILRDQRRQGFGHTLSGYVDGNRTAFGRSKKKGRVFPFLCLVYVP